MTNPQDFVRMHIPQHKKVNSILKRHRSCLDWFYPHYDMFFVENMHFMMSSKRKPCNFSSTYHMGTRKDPVN